MFKIGKKYKFRDLCDTPRYDVIAMFKMFESLNCDMYIWSGGGVDYAKRWAEKLGLKANIIPKGSIKVDLAVDDMAHESELSLGVMNLGV